MYLYLVYRLFLKILEQKFRRLDVLLNFLCPLRRDRPYIDKLFCIRDELVRLFVRMVRGELLGILFFEDVGKFSVFGRDGRRRVGNNGINMDTVST